MLYLPVMVAITVTDTEMEKSIEGNISLADSTEYKKNIKLEFADFQTIFPGFLRRLVK